MIVRFIQIRLRYCGRIKRIPGIMKLDNQPAWALGQRQGDENTAIKITYIRMIDDVCTGLMRRKLQIVGNRLALSYVLDANKQLRDTRAKNIQMLMGCR